MSLGCLCGGLGSHWLCFTKQVHCAIKKTNAWRKLKRGHKLKSWLLPRGMAAAAGEEQARSQYHSATFQHTTDLVFPIGTGIAGLVWTLGRCRLLVGSRPCSIPSQAYQHSYSCNFMLAVPSSLPEHQIRYPVLPSVLLGVGFWLYTVLRTFPKEFYGSEGSYCSHSKFYRLWKDLGLNVLCQSKNGLFPAQPSPGFGYSSVRVHLRHLIQNTHRLFHYFGFSYASFCVVLN